MRPQETGAADQPAQRQTQIQKDTNSAQGETGAETQMSFKTVDRKKAWRAYRECCGKYGEALRELAKH